MAEKVPAKSEKKWELTKIQAIIVVVIGSLLLVPSLLISSKVGSTTHTIEVVLGFIGACVIFVGVWRRPMNAEKIK